VAEQVEVDKVVERHQAVQRRHNLSCSLDLSTIMSVQ